MSAVERTASPAVEAAIAEAESALRAAREALDVAELSLSQENEALDSARDRLASLDGEPEEIADRHARLTGEIAIRAGRVTRADDAVAAARQTLADAQKRVAGAEAGRWTEAHTEASQAVHVAVEALAGALGSYVETLRAMPAGLVTGRALREIEPARLVGLAVEAVAGSVPGLHPVGESGGRMFEKRRGNVEDVLALLGGRVASATGRLDLWPPAITAALDAFAERERKRYAARHPPKPVIEPVPSPPDGDALEDAPARRLLPSSPGAISFTARRRRE